MSSRDNFKFLTSVLKRHLLQASALSLFLIAVYKDGIWNELVQHLLVTAVSLGSSAVMTALLILCWNLLKIHL